MKFKTRLGVILTAAILGATSPALAAPKSIFDDDWTPPKQTVTPPKPAAATEPPKTPDAPAKPDQPSSEKPATPADPDAAAPARRPVPSKPEQAAVRKLMKEVYADAIADRSLAGRRKLTETLLAQADKSANAPVDQFVLLAAAVDAALEAGSLPLAFAAADRMATTFDVDGLGVKADAALGLRTAAAGGAAGMAENVNAVLALTQELESAEAVATAVKVATAVQPIASAASADLRTKVLSRLRELAAAREIADRVAKDREKLKSAPDDPAANLSMGRYLCFVKGDWPAGLPMLAKGSDPALKALAAQELAGPPDKGDAAAKLADAWWDVAAKQPDAPSRGGAYARAAELYKLAVNDAAGLRKVQIEKRLAEAGAKATSSAAGTKTVAARKAGVVNLLTMFNAKGAVAGQWQFVKGALVSDESNYARIQSTYRPPSEYDFTIEFTRTQGKGTIAQLLSRGDRSFEWTIGAAGETSRLQDVNGHARNGTARKLPPELANAERHTCVVQVRNTGVKALLDGNEVLDFPTDFNNLSRNNVWKMADDGFLGLGSYGGPMIFHKVEVIEISK